MRRAALLLLLALFPVAQCRLSFPARPRVAEPAPTRTRERERGVIRLGKPREQLGRLRQLLAGLLADRRKRRVLVAVVVFNWLQTQARLHFGKRRALRAFSKLERPEVTIVTTAALPWMTGTAVNALLRAAYLAESGYRVTLCVPWIHPEEQLLVMPKGKLCADPDAQEQLMRTWLSERDGAVAPFDIRFYPARFDVMRGSILPIGDTTRWVGDSYDLCVLEEPEHLNWYHGGGQWRRCFKLVVGVVHTNYLRYASLYQPENVWVVRFINKLVCRAYCDRIVKLSDSLQELPRSTSCNVHGVRAEFLALGRQAARPGHVFTEGAYFIGKLLWAKGHGLLIDYLAGEEGLHVDLYGNGEDSAKVQAAAAKAAVDLRFFSGRDHSDESIHAYKVFVNPSQTEVLSTTTAEALAMGKFVVIERRPENAFFERFANVFTYETPEQFRVALRTALASTPAPLSEEESHALSWAGGTERFLGAVAEASRLAAPPRLGDKAARCMHLWVCGAGLPGYLGDAVRKFVFESGPVSRQRWLTAERRYRRS